MNLLKWRLFCFTVDFGDLTLNLEAFDSFLKDAALALLTTLLNSRNGPILHSFLQLVEPHLNITILLIELFDFLKKFLIVLAHFNIIEGEHWIGEDLNHCSLLSHFFELLL